LNSSLNCDFTFALENNNKFYDITIPKSSRQFVTHLLGREFSPGESNFKIKNAVNRTIVCDDHSMPRETYFITTSLNQLNSPKLKLFHYNSNSLYNFCTVIGWIYFFAWSISFYPQIFLNFKRKSTLGLNLDFVILNIIGFFCYSVYNFCLYFNESLLREYFKKYPENLEPVQGNDVVFAIHALILSLLTLAQIYHYSFNKSFKHFYKSLTNLSKSFFYFLIFFTIYLTLSSKSNLETIFSISYIKVLITLIKYIPQAISNFTRKSTIGFSIDQILLDLAGGVLSILQMVLEGANFEVKAYNPAKLALGCISLIFDTIFMVQHYVLYKGIGPASDTQRLLGTDD